ncbi:MAG: CSLREA domain-containing protein [bacterium]
MNAWRRAALVATWMCAASAARATTIPVDSTADDYDQGPNGNCTLREAVLSANQDAPVDACPAGSGADTIALPAGTYRLTIPAENYEREGKTGGLVLEEDVEILGAGRDETVIDAEGIATAIRQSPYSSFHLDDLLIDGLTISHGVPYALEIRDGAVTLIHAAFRDNGSYQVGGGLDISGSGLMIEDCELTGNHGPNGGAMWAVGPVTIRDTLFARNEAFLTGGAIYVSSGTVFLSRAVVRDSTAYWGGAVWAAPGTALIAEQSSLVDNHAAAEGGGLLVGGTVALTNVTLAGNSAIEDGGALATSGGAQVTLTNVTLADNDAPQGSAISTLASIAQIDPILLVNSIVAGECVQSAGPPVIFSQGGNLESPGDTCGFALESDLVRVSDPGLGSLGDHGGTVPTVALLAGSPAIDSAVESACPDTDARGVPRPQSGSSNGGEPHCDRGAYEACLGPDSDSDGIPDACDDCAAVADPDQQDSNWNGIGDACELFVDDFEWGDTSAWSQVRP